MEKKKIFISHIGEEASLGTVLKDWIESTFSGNCDVFLSSDIDNIPAGTQWLEEIDEALNDSDVLIVLCSRNSITRPWINFEAGCGWIKRVPIISICYLGVNKSTLPEPLSRFQNLNLDDDNFVSDLFSSFKKHFNLTRIPKIDQNQMKKELKDALNHIESEESELIPEETLEKEPIHEVKNALPAEADRILSYLSSNAREENYVSNLSRFFGMKEEKMNYFLDLLIDHDLIDYHLNMMRPTVYTLSRVGRKYLVEIGLL